MDPYSTNSDTQQQPGIIDSVTGFFGKIGNALSNKDQHITKDTARGATEGGLLGGARSRRRKCNKKHRHTKSCRKNVKKGRKTRKH